MSKEDLAKDLELAIKERDEYHKKINDLTKQITKLKYKIKQSKNVIKHENSMVRQMFGKTYRELTKEEISAYNRAKSIEYKERAKKSLGN